MSKKSLYLILGAVIVVVVIALVATRSGQAPTQTPPQAGLGGPLASAITSAVMSRSVDAQGNATGVATIFSGATDRIVYAVLTLQNSRASTTLSYVRYLNGKFVDSKVAHPGKDGITHFYFSFEKGIGSYPTGTYTLNLYVDGKRSTTLTYVFQ